MTVRVAAIFGAHLGELRFEPIAKRIRAKVDGVTVADSVRTVLVWEPRRVVPSYAMPVDDLAGDVVDLTEGEAATGVDAGAYAQRPVLDPSVPFAVHTAPGRRVGVRAGDRTIDGYRLDDPALDGYVLLDFAGADEWYEEDERNHAHPRDPFHRIDVVPSSRRIRIEVDGTVLADTTRARLLSEAMLPTRYYLPVEDVQVELRPSDSVTHCAYKGRASYLSPVVGERVLDDLVWLYREPLHDAEPVRDLVCFFDERVDVFVDGQPRTRPITPWSR